MNNQRNIGVFYALSSYLIWGFTPIYWKLFAGVDSTEILAHRIFWAFFIALGTLGFTGGFGRFREVLKDRSQLGWIVLRTLLLAVNWYTYVWAVGHGRVLEASLGYYLNPLVSILLGLIFLKERLTALQWTAVAFAGVGVAFKTILVGGFPLVSIVLALSFGFYGLMKKKSTEGSIVGMMLESFILLPVAAGFLIFREVSGSGVFLEAGIGMKFLFATTGIITVFPLILFAKGASRIPLAWVGFLQFIAPTMMLLFGVLVYKETMSAYDLIGFIAVWTGIAIFLISSKKNRKEVPR